MRQRLIEEKPTLPHRSTRHYRFRAFDDGQAGVVLHDLGRRLAGIGEIELEKIGDPSHVVFAVVPALQAHDVVRADGEGCR